MRAVLPSVLVALVLSSVASANMAPPGIKGIPREIHVEFAEPYQGYTFFVVSFGHIARLPSTEGSIDLSQLVGYSYVAARYGPPGRNGFDLVAVPDDLVANLRRGEPDSTWFEENRSHPRLRWANFNPTIVEAPTTDPRKRIIQTYRAKLTETDLEVKVTSETAIPDSSGDMVAVMVGAAVVVGLICCLVWCIRRLFRRLPVTRTAPPPGN